MPRLRSRVLANYAGQIWVALMGIAFVPAYLRALGAEQFGLIAFMLSLQALSLLLDMGVGVFLSRELAQRMGDPDHRNTIRRLIRSFEWLVWPTAFAMAAVIFLLAGPISADWLKPEQLARTDTASAVRLMGLVVALLWPTSFYSAALSGLEQQPRLNALVVVFSTLRFAGVLPVLHYTNSGLQGFLLWHAAIAAGQTACSAWLTWHVLPPSTQAPRFDISEIFKARRFALGVFAVTALGLLLSQADRLIFSALRPLQEFGYYAVAISISAGLGRFVQPMFNAIYPRLSRFAASGDTARMSDLYHLSSQIVAVMVAAITSVICVYAKTLLWLWTGDAALAEQVALPLTLLLAGSAINGVMNLPYALQLAHGWTRLGTLSNLVAALTVVPLYVIAIGRHGMVGAASVWLALNLGYLALVAPLMHRRLLQGELTRWYIGGVLPPAAATVAISLLAKTLRPELNRDFSSLAWLAAVGLLALAAGSLASTDIRKAIHRYISDFRPPRAR